MVSALPKKLGFMLIVLMTLTNSLCAQEEQSEAKILKMNDSPEKINQLNSLAKSLISSKPKKTIKLADAALDIAIKLDYVEGEMAAEQNLYLAYQATKDATKAKKYFAMYEKTKDRATKILQLREEVERKKQELEASSKAMQEQLSRKDQDMSSLNKKLELTQMQTQKIKNEKDKISKENDSITDLMRLQILEKAAIEDSLTLLSLDNQLRNAEMEVQRANQKNFKIGLMLVFTMLTVALAGLFLLVRSSKKLTQSNKIISQQKIEVEKQRNRSDDLLLNILPENIADELKQNGLVVPKYYPNVTVLFADFKNFTGISAKLTPEQLVNEIDYYFQNLDLLMEKYGIEKIKTIGDAYMCVSGLNSDAGTHAKTMVRLALDIQKFMEEDKATRKREKRQIWELRIGINSGSVVGGVVGSKKFAFDIWGDTVNVASRMESNGEVGKVNISQDVYLQIKDEFLCTHRGRIPIKNKDEVDMYFVEKVIS